MQLRSKGKLAGPKLFVFVVDRGKCYLIFQLTITITVDISVDSNNRPYNSQLVKWGKEEIFIGGPLPLDKQELELLLYHNQAVLA